jgi:hypothetical protein
MGDLTVKACPIVAQTPPTHKGEARTNFMAKGVGQFPRGEAGTRGREPYKNLQRRFSVSRKSKRACRAELENRLPQVSILI